MFLDVYCFFYYKAYIDPELSSFTSTQLAVRINYYINFIVQLSCFVQAIMQVYEGETGFD